MSQIFNTFHWSFIPLTFYLIIVDTFFIEKFFNDNSSSLIGWYVSTEKYSKNPIKINTVIQNQFRGTIFLICLILFFFFLILIGWHFNTSLSMIMLIYSLLPILIYIYIHYFFIIKLFHFHVYLFNLKDIELEGEKLVVKSYGQGLKILIPQVVLITGLFSLCKLLNISFSDITNLIRY